ncbi:MAG: hypothetical protein GY906_04245 [bacterium]|nr:hypothetical protein [bacterium]
MSPAAYNPDQPVESFKQLLRDLLKGYDFDVKGLILNDGSIEPLPREASVIGKVLEISIKHYLRRRLLQVNNLVCIPASSDRTYPDFTFNGEMVHPNRFAVDLKCARRNKKGDKTDYPITIGTYDAEYYHYPDDKVANIEMPYGSYTAHLAVIAFYDYVDTTAQNIELLVVDKWRVATKKRSSGTRCYIAALSGIEALRAESGGFPTEEAFNSFWRAQEVKPSKLAKWIAKREKK